MKASRNLFHRYSVPLVLTMILLFGAWARLFRVNEFMPFYNEQVDSLLAMRHIWQAIVSFRFSELPLHGPSGTYPANLLPPGTGSPIYHGSFYYYFHLPFAVLSRFDPYGVALWLIGLGTVDVYLFYVAGVTLFRRRSVGLLAALLAATSFWLAVYSRWLDTPMNMPFFALLALIAFFRVLDGQKRWWYVLAFTLAAGSQIHDSGYIPLFIYGTFLLRWRPPLPHGVVKKITVAGLFLTPVLPTLLDEMVHGFPQTHALGVIPLKAVLLAPYIGRSITLFLEDAFAFPSATGSLHLLHTTVLSVSTLIGGLFIIATMLSFYITQRKRHLVTTLTKRRMYRVRTFFTVWWLVFLPIPVAVEYIYWKTPINAYSRMSNLLFALPILIISVSYVICRLWETRMVAIRILTLGFITFYMVLNIQGMNDVLWHMSTGISTYGEQKRLATEIVTLARGEPYNLRIYRSSIVDTKTYEPIYIIYQSRGDMPESYNGNVIWGGQYPLMLRGKTAMQTIVVVKNGIAVDGVSEKTLPTARVGSYNIYRLL